MKYTTSICLKCRKEVSASIEELWEGAFMTQHCPICGDRTDIVEKSVSFHKVFGYRRTGKIFNSLMVDITDACNADCKLCYHPKGNNHKSVDEILKITNYFKDKNIWVSGGEPTCHPELFDIVSKMPNFRTLLTNGYRFANVNYLQEFSNLTGNKKEFPCEISINPDPHEFTLQCLENLRSLGKTIDSGMFSITNIDDVEKSLDIWDQWSDVVINGRIRTPFNVWSQQADKTLFLSDVYRKVTELAPMFSVTQDLGGNSIYNVNLKSVNRYLILCSSPNRNAFDVEAVKYAPDMLANDGKVYPIPHGLLINEFLGEA
jgi:hypothetical protein